MTILRFPVWYSYYPTLLDSLFEVTYFIGQPLEATSPQGHFYTLGYNALVQLPYTIRATCILVEKGFYFESINLVRNMFESLFQLRYFHKHPEAIKAHMLGHRIQIKKMFQEIAPGFYDDTYAKILSEFAHSGIASSLFRTKHSSPEVGETTMGTQFDEAGCTFTLNKIIVIVFGILNCTQVLFPQYFNLVTDATEAKRKDSLAWLDSVMKSHIEERPETKEFYDQVNPLMCM